jgi:small subunit ribosomal protein S8
MMTDPIADMLTRIRNANSIYRSQVEIPHSKIKESIAQKLMQQGFIKEYKVIEAVPQKKILVTLKYGPDGEKIMREITRVSKPGRRIYKKAKLAKKSIIGYGIAIFSTSKGILTDQECLEQKVGGELLCTIW